MSVTRSQPSRRGLVRARFKPATSWRAGLLGLSSGQIRVNAATEYVFVRVGNAGNHRVMLAYLDRRSVQNDTLLPPAGTPVKLDQGDDGMLLVNIDALWQFL